MSLGGSNLFWFSCGTWLKMARYVKIPIKILVPASEIIEIEILGMYNVS